MVPETAKTRTARTPRAQRAPGRDPRPGVSPRGLPAVDRLVEAPALASLRARLDRAYLVPLARTVLEEARRNALAGQALPSLEQLAETLRERGVSLRDGGMQRVLNATGVILHTNLGRAPLADETVRTAMEAAAGPVSVELDLATGERGNRYASIQRLLSALTGCESAIVVNNNAAAVLLVLSTFAHGRDVLLSRGEMIEIGGSFRLPEIIRASGARLVEVGTTNRTHLEDFRRALSPSTGLLMKAHTSNFRIAGFTSSVSAAELCGLSKEHGVPVFEDLGSGSLVDLRRYGLTPEPTVQQVIASGVPIVSFSGDKLLGGPQAGILLGERAPIEALMRNQLLRALRVDKLTLALLEKTLQLYLDPMGPARRIPAHRMLARNLADLEADARTLAGQPGLRYLKLRAVADSAAVGGGACPTDALPTWVVEVAHDGTGPEELARRLRLGSPPVLGRVRGGCFCLDLRSLLPEESGVLRDAIGALDDTLAPDA